VERIGLLTVGSLDDIVQDSTGCVAHDGGDEVAARVRRSASVLSKDLGQFPRSFTSQNGRIYAIRRLTGVGGRVAARYRENAMY
jgi:plasmid stabilization system protein ParE